MKDDISKLIQKMKPGKQGLNRIVENKSVFIQLTEPKTPRAKQRIE